MRKLQYLFLLVYIVLYIWGWKVFLEVEAFAYLKPYAYVWTVSAFICFVLAKSKGQIPFTGFFMGSFLGPLAAIIILFSEKDPRCFKEEEKDEKFYERLYSKMEDTFYNGFLANGIDLFADYFKIKLDMRCQFSLGYPNILLVLKEYKRIFLEFNKEYKLKFGRDFGKIEGMIEEIDKRINKWEK